MDRLYDYSKGTKHKLKLSKVIFDIVFGLNGRDYANIWKMPGEVNNYATSLNDKKDSINWEINYQ